MGLVSRVSSQHSNVPDRWPWGTGGRHRPTGIGIWSWELGFGLVQSWELRFGLVWSPEPGFESRETHCRPSCRDWTRLLAAGGGLNRRWDGRCRLLISVCIAGH